MPYEIKWSPKMVRRIFFESVSGWDMLKSSLDVYADKRFDQIDYQIIDFSKAEKLKFVKLDIQKIDQIERAAKKSNWTLSVFVIFPSDQFETHLWFLKSYGRETAWHIVKAESEKELFGKIK